MLALDLVASTLGEIRSGLGINLHDDGDPVASASWAECNVFDKVGAWDPPVARCHGWVTLRPIAAANEQLRLGTTCVENTINRPPAITAAAPGHVLDRTNAFKTNAAPLQETR